MSKLEFSPWADLEVRPHPKERQESRFKCSATNKPAEGQRDFSVQVEGKTEFSGTLETGKQTVCVVERVPVKDGCLDIRFIHSVDNPKISALEVEWLK